MLVQMARRSRCASAAIAHAYPFEKTDVAARFVETANITEAERMQVASANATRILHLDRRRAVGAQGCQLQIPNHLLSPSRSALSASARRMGMSDKCH